MIKKRLFGLAAMFLLLAFPVSAFMVSVLVVETGLSEEASSMPYAGLWEGGLMDAFFDAGHIVTNSPAARMEKKPSQIFTGFLEEDYNDAVSGGAEYFILCFLEYQNRGGVVSPVRMDLKLYKTDSRRLVYEQNFPVGSGKNNDEEFQLAKKAGLTIISQIKDK